MAPTQLSRQCRDNLAIREHFGETNHMSQCFDGESATVTRDQLSRQRRDNFHSVCRTRTRQDVTADSITNLPMKGGKPHIDRLSDPPSRGIDELPEVLDQGLRPTSII